MSLIGEISKFCEFVPMEQGTGKRGRPGRDLSELDPGVAERAARAQLIRVASGAKSAADFSRKLQVSPQRWSNCERGGPVSREMMSKLVAVVPGLSRDYIEDGDKGRLSVEFADRLAKAEASLMPSPDRPKSPKAAKR
jgi:hypothetical protein